ncbi:MAG: PP2C family protein-serine/threonine phosphatase [Chloroflexota bacterium]|jgi:serine/threonine protein phosphatase PrpC|nr:serine/threonine-protein phosphatase [Chloroflexota bacterium]NCA15026.1 serine/threonine-protein phosphatase [Pseudomonadota bacterium]
MILDHAEVTHPGRIRPHNEDAVGCLLPERGDAIRKRGAIFAVADGVGGQSAGEVASAMAIRDVIAGYVSPTSPHAPEAALTGAVQAANARVHAVATGGAAETAGMQTTLSVLVLCGRQSFVAHAGDSRIYRLRDGTLSRLTADHSEAAELVRLRLIAPEDAASHPRRSVLTRTLGATPRIRPDFSRAPVEDGDRFLLCTDGLWGEVQDHEIASAMAMPPEGGCERLVAMANERGGGDNVSVSIIHVRDAGQQSPVPATVRLARLLSGLRGG